MSRTPVQPHPEVARAVGAMLFGGILSTQVLGLPRGFEIEGYVGVFMIFSCLLAWAGAAWLLVEGGKHVWWYTLADAALTILAWLLTLLFGLPVIDEPLKGRWLDRHNLLLLFFSANLTVLAGWVLWGRRRSAHAPVSSARERARRQR
ncbi:hypothetical protein [Actinocorallia populi]|uniref:hypothetical protein n=1 Tax=Actinocorallia populi TaxID=2079200 RepID=UPI000D0898FF|nr:hypothetical protein [Actinocorallia populi]